MRPSFNIIATLLLSFILMQCKPKAAVNQQTSANNAASELSTSNITSITNIEISGWEFAKTKQVDKLKDLLADDYQAFFGKVLMDKKDVLLSFQRSNINAYRLSNIRTKKVSEDVAIIYYEVLQDATDPEGQKWVPQVAASTTYVKRGNKWYPVFYHETALLAGL